MTVAVPLWVMPPTVAVAFTTALPLPLAGAVYRPLEFTLPGPLTIDQVNAVAIVWLN